MTKDIVKIGLFLGLVVGLMSAPLNVFAQNIPPQAELEAERSIGAKTAPVTMIEFASLTCPHCANFHNLVLPTLKKEYIETGKVRMVYKDFPLDQLATVAAMMARCAKPNQYFGVINILFKSQQKWARSSDPATALAQIGRLAGISRATFDACIKSQQVFDGVMKSRNEGNEKYKVQSTPTFIVNGRKIDGGLPIEDFRKVLNKAIADAK